MKKRARESQKYSEKLQNQLKDQQETITKLLQQVIVLERDNQTGPANTDQSKINSLQTPSFNSLQNLLNFDNFRNLEVRNQNMSYRIDQMDRELSRITSDLKDKND
jgi:hypothetical protein